MTYLATGADLLADSLRKAGEKTDGTSDYASDALAYLNGHYQKFVAGGNDFDVDLGDPWVWAKSKFPGTLTLKVPYSTGLVTVTQNSNVITFSSPPPTSQTDCILKVNGIFEYYRITAHTAGSANATLDSVFNDATQSSPFQSIQLYYDLNPGVAIVRLFSPMKVYRAQTSDADYEGKIVGLDIRSFEKKYPWLRLTAGVPTEFAPILNSNGLYTVQFNKFVSIQTKVDYDFIPVPTDLADSGTSIPVIPLAHRETLSLATAYSLLKDKKDAEADHFFQLTQRALKAMMLANRREFMQISKNRGRLVARGDDFGVRNWPTSGDLNS